jgi:hypothetical protein
MTQLQNALITSGISQIVISSGDPKKGTHVTLKVPTKDIPDASLLILMRYGITRKGNDTVNTAWGRHKDLVAQKKEKPIPEQQFRKEELEAFEKTLLSGDWTTKRARMSYEEKATREELKDWLKRDGMGTEGVKKIATDTQQLWDTVIRRQWIKFAQDAGMTPEDIGKTNIEEKIEANREAVEQSFADAIEERAAALKVANEGTQSATISSGLTL